MAEETITLLLASGNPVLHETLGPALQRIFGPQMKLVGCRSARETIEALSGVTFRVMLIDSLLEDVSGVSFVRSYCRRMSPPCALFLLGSRLVSDSEVIELLRNHPLVNYVSYPYDVKEVSLRAYELAHPSPRKDLTFFGLRLVDLIQAFNLSRQSVTIQVLTRGNRIGSIYLRDGILINATYSDQEGLDALVRILRNEGGEVRVQKACLTARQTIFKPTQQVLLDVCRVIDETLPALPKRSRSGKQPTVEDILGEIDLLFAEEGASSEGAGKPPPPRKKPLTAHELLKDILLD